MALQGGGGGGSIVLHRPIGKNFKNLLIWKQKAQVFDIWYIASSVRN